MKDWVTHIIPALISAIIFFVYAIFKPKDFVEMVKIADRSMKLAIKHLEKSEDA